MLILRSNTIFIFLFNYVFSDDLIVLTAFGTAAVVATQNCQMEEQNCNEGTVEFL